MDQEENKNETLFRGTNVDEGNCEDEEMKESDLEENGGCPGEQTDEIASSPATITRPKVNGLQPL